MGSSKVPLDRAWLSLSTMYHQSLCPRSWRLPDLVKHWFDFHAKNSGFWQLFRNSLVKHDAFLCSIDSVHRDLSFGMFILGVGSLVMVPEGFKHLVLCLYGRL